MLLKVISNYLRRKLHIPKYSYMYEDKEQFDRETKALFAETPTLESQLEKLRVVTSKIAELCHENSDVKVSFAVFESF